MADHKPFLVGIEAGDYDGGLADIVAACRERAEEADRSLRWRITIDGETWDEDTITIGEMRFVERATDTNWALLTPLKSADVLTSFVIARWHKVGGMDLQAAWEKAEALNAKALVEAVSEYEVDGAGKDPAAPTN